MNTIEPSTVSSLSSVWWLAGAFSIATAAVSIAVASWAVRKWPLGDEHEQKAIPTARSTRQRLVRNFAGVCLVGIGFALLFLPGQGVLTILAGLSLLDTPAS